MLSAVIFDMDGTMFETDKLWGDVLAKMSREYDIQYDPAVRTGMMGKKDHEALTVYRDFFKLEASVDNLVMRRRELILADIHLARVCAGLFELLDLLDEMRIKKSVATSSFKELAGRLLRQFNVEHRFDFIITGDDVEVSKPNPTMFFEAARALGAEPAQCLVLEDAQNGVEAAYNAGMRVFAIPHADSKHHDFSKADRILTSLLEVDKATLATL